MIDAETDRVGNAFNIPGQLDVAPGRIALVR
jgi:hypothetical protein